jgi:hypothetical protein
MKYSAIPRNEFAIKNDIGETLLARSVSPNPIQRIPSIYLVGSIGNDSRKI